jgi:hypothetical protein
MGLFDNFPYTNFHELNLDWLLRMIKELNNTVENFVALNTIKYADPIQWNITTQYEANTVVVDPQSGTAYISTKAVPTGVAITNTDYWTVIFTLDVISANKNLTLRDDGSNVLATFASAAGDWLLWNGTLYKVSQAISVNEAYVVGYNLDRYTVELFIKDYVSALNTIIGDLDDLTTTDKDSIVEAINELVANIGGLSDLNTTDKDSIVDAINELVVNIGNLSDLNTTNKDSIVDAINEIVSSMSGVVYIANEHGILPSNADNTSAFQDLIDLASTNNGCIVFKGGKYNFSGSVEVYKNIRIIGLGEVIFDYSNASTADPLITILNDRLQTDFDIHYEQANAFVIFENITFCGCLPASFPTIPTEFNGTLIEFQVPYVTIRNCNFKSFEYVFTYASHSYCINIESCSIHYNKFVYYFDGLSISDAGENMLFTNCIIGNNIVVFHNIMSTLFVSHCSIDYNKVIAESQHGSSGFNLTAFDRFDSCYFEDANNSDFSEFRFKDYYTNRTFRTFINCSFFSMYQPVYKLGNVRTRVNMSNCNFYNMPSNGNKFFDYADNTYGAVSIKDPMYTGITDVFFEWGAPHNIIKPTYIDLVNNVVDGTASVDSDYNLTLTNTTSARCTVSQKNIKIPEGSEFCLLRLVNSGGSYPNTTGAAAIIRGYDQNGNQISSSTINGNFGSDGGTAIGSLSLSKSMDYIQIDITPSVATNGASIIYSDVYAYFA